ncbi:MAG: hypothetical protein AB7K24_30475 [Gemmataceae bacterium]
MNDGKKNDLDHIDKNIDPDSFDLELTEHELNDVVGGAERKDYGLLRKVRIGDADLRQQG